MKWERMRWEKYITKFIRFITFSSCGLDWLDFPLLFVHNFFIMHLYLHFGTLCVEHSKDKGINKIFMWENSFFFISTRFYFIFFFKNSKHFKHCVFSHRFHIICCTFFNFTFEKILWEQVKTAQKKEGCKQFFIFTIRELHNFVEIVD